MNISKESLQKIAAANQANPYADITPYETGVGMPIVHYSGFFAQPGECIIYAAPAQTFKDKPGGRLYREVCRSEFPCCKRCHRPHGKFRW